MNLSGTGLGLRRGGRALLDEVSITIAPGELHVVLGANGAGKSTLLRVLAGEFVPDCGEVGLNGRALHAWSPRQRACLRAVLSQFDLLQTDFLAADVVALGRYPCWRQSERLERALIEEALAQTDATAFAERRYLSLSGGERRRVQLARARVQVAGPLPPELKHAPRYFLLDEPTASLDLAHRHRALALLRRLAREGLGVLAVLHDPELAMRYADRVTLLAAGRCIAQGAPEDALAAGLLRQAYGIEAEWLPQPPPARPLLRVQGVSSPEP